MLKVAEWTGGNGQETVEVSWQRQREKRNERERERENENQLSVPAGRITHRLELIKAEQMMRMRGRLICISI